MNSTCDLKSKRPSVKMTTAVDPSESFRRLQPVCVKLSKQCTRANVSAVAATIGVIPSHDLRELFDFTIFPLKLAVDRPDSSNELKQAAVGCLEVLVGRAGIDNFQRFREIFTMLLKILSAKEDQLQYRQDLSEEFKMAVTSCLTCVLNSASAASKESLYSTKFLPVLGHAVWVLLALAENEKARGVRLNALNCLQKLVPCSERGGTKIENCPAEPKESAAVSFASFLPGISVKLCRLVSGDPKLGHSVVTAALELWSSVLSLVMADEHMPEQSSNNTDMVSQLADLALQDRVPFSRKEEKTPSRNVEERFISDTETKLNGLKVQITAEWREDTAGKLNILLQRLGTLVNHTSWKVRRGLGDFAGKLLSCCAVSAQPCVPVLVDLLVGLTRDEYPQVASQSKLALRTFSLNKIQSASTSLRSLCEENLHALLTSLPQLIMRTADDGKKLQTVNLVVGYLSLLGRGVGILLKSAAHLKRLSLALMQVLELDLSDVGIVEEKTSLICETAVPSSDTKGEKALSFPVSQFVTRKYPKYRFKHFTDERIHTAVTQLCCLLGYHGDLPLLVDHFLDLFHKSQTHQKQAVLVLNHIVRGHLGQGIGEATGVLEDDPQGDNGHAQKLFELDGSVELLLSEYTADCNLHRPTSSQSSVVSSERVNRQDLTITQQEKPVRGLSFDVLNSNIQLACLLLEGIGILSQIPSHGLEPFLMTTIYPVMSKLGDENATVSRSAYGTLLQICQSCGHVSIAELISANADYLVNAISLNLKYVFVDGQAPRVLQVMIQYSNASILSIIEDTLMDVFAVIDFYPEQLMHTLFKVLNVLICSVKQWFPVSGKRDGDQEERPEIGPTDSVAEQDVDVPEDERKPSPDHIREFFLDYHKRKQIALGNVDPEDLTFDSTHTVQGDDLEDESASFEADHTPEIPLHVKYVKQILEKCIHFLPAKSAWVRLLVLDTVQNGALALRDAEDQLLPMIHRLWPAMVKRFTDDEKIVAIKAVNVLCTMAEASGDFTRRRVLKDAVPVLTAFLDKQALTSKKAGPAYSRTHACHLQEAVLTGLGRLGQQLDIGEMDLNHIACSCTPYLSCRQPKELQEAAVQAFGKFISLEPDHMWLTLNELYCPEEPSPPHAMFTAVRLGGVGPENEYSDNVKLLLKNL